MEPNSVSPTSETAGTEPRVCFLALTVDLVGSRELADRAGVQRALIEGVEALNARWLEPVSGRGGPISGWLAAPVRISAGDEVQALFRAPGQAVFALTQLADLVHPVALAAGFGWGTLELGPAELQAAAAGDVDPMRRVAVAPDVALLDGACFHRARAALEVAKREGALGHSIGFGTDRDLALSVQLELLGRLRAGWTLKQAATVAAARERSQREVAALQGVSPSVVSESLKAASFASVERAEAALDELMRRWGSASGARWESNEANAGAHDA